MEIKLKTSPRGESVTVEIDQGKTLEDLVAKYQEELPFQILAARVDNKLEALTMVLKKPCSVELLDMRDAATNLIYQHSLILIYLKATYDTLGKVQVNIRNSINKGIFTTIELKSQITEAQVKAIEERMREIIALDIPFVRELMPKEEALQMLLAEGQREKARLLLTAKDATEAKFYTLDDVKDFFYGLMVPSTGYIKQFELHKYRKGVLLRFPHPQDPNKIPDYVDEVRLYDAFKEATEWSKLLGISFVADLNESIQTGQYKDVIQLSEALHEKKTAEIADMITKQNKRIVLIAGPSSSGKTTFAKRLCIQLRVNGHSPLYLSTDDYFVERSQTPLDEYGEPAYEDLDAIEVGMFNEHMNALLDGQEVDLPTFDFKNGTKVFGKRILRIDEDQPIVIEGIHALNEAMTPNISKAEKFKIYISPFAQLNIDDHNRIPVTDVRMLRRMVRDYQFRGSSAQTTITAWPKVRHGENKNIFPYSNEADVFFNSAYIYEVSVLKKYAEPLLKAIRPDEPQYSDAIRLLKFLRFFETIEDDSMIVNNSIIREFIGGSIFK